MDLRGEDRRAKAAHSVTDSQLCAGERARSAHRAPPSREPPPPPHEDEVIDRITAATVSSGATHKTEPLGVRILTEHTLASGLYGGRPETAHFAAAFCEIPPSNLPYSTCCALRNKHRRSS